ncbi:MAG: membrane protein insertion efficiency factor YidD [Ornithinimicrobium sp.]
MSARIVAMPLIWIVVAYQYLISPLLGPTCKFYPSCSAYAVTALTEHGAIRGSWLAGTRLLRCHPWTHGGVDHVPPRRAPARSLTGEHSSPRI